MNKRLFAAIVLFIFILTSFCTVITVRIKSVEINGDNDLSFENTHPFIESSLITRRNRIRPHFYGIDVQNSNIVTVVGETRVILRTTNGGKIWREQYAWTNRYEKLLDVSFYDENVGMAVGIQNTIVYTKDGGLRWHTAQHPGIFQPIMKFWAAQMLTPKIGFAAGQPTTFIPLVARTDDLWQSWEYSNPEKILQGKIIESEDGVTRARYFPTVLVRIKDNYGKEYLL